MKLSEILLQQIEDLDKDREGWEGPTDPQFEKFHQFLDRVNIDSVESLLPEDLAKLASLVRSRKDLLEWSLDDQYSRTLVKQIPKIVRRAQQLEPMYVKKTLQGPVETYLREATRAYLFGLFQASVALSRSALEKGSCWRSGAGAGNQS